jgi:hypothetical protein
MSPAVEIDWASAEVHGGDMTVELAGKASKRWRERFEAVRGLLGESSGGWDDVKIVKQTINVRGLRPGAERDLRHFLESIVVQVDAELADDDTHEQDARPADGAATADAEMTATLRSFAEPQARR